MGAKMFESSGKLAFDKYYPTLLAWYVLLFCIYLVLGWIAFFGYFQEVKQVCANFFAVVGLLLLAYDLVARRSLLRVPFKTGLIVFLASIVISSLIYVEYGWSSNAKCFAWTCIQVGLMVPFVRICSKKEVQFVARWILVVSLGVWTLAAIGSICEYIVQVGFAFIDGEGLYQRQGFIDGRLFGLFVDPNYAACFALGLIVASLIWMRQEGFNRKYRKLVWACLGINWFYFILAQSRTAYLALVAVLVLFALYVFNESRSGEQEERCRLRRTLAAAVAAPLLSIALITPLAACYATWANEVDLFGFNQLTEEWGSAIPGRDDVSVENISNNRFDIWRDYLYTSKDDLLFGKSPRNDSAIILERYPDLYISTRNAGDIYVCHNGYLDLFISTGVVGFLGLAFTGAGLVLSGIRYVRRRQKIGLPTFCALLIFAIICVKALTHTVPFFTYSIESNLFWLLLGLLLCVFDSRGGEGDTFDARAMTRGIDD